MTLSNDIQDAIRKSLPEQTAAELKEYIEEAQRHRHLLDQTLEDKIRLTRALEVKSKECATLDSYRNKEGELSAKEKDLEKLKSDLNHQANINDIRRDVAAEKVQHMFEVMKLVFKSQPVGYAFATNRNESVQVPDPHNTYSTKTMQNSSNEYVTKKEITE